jgi:hypothetical protein
VTGKPSFHDEEFFNGIYTADRIVSGSTKTTRFRGADAREWMTFLRSSGVIELLATWRAEDREKKAPGGVKPKIDDLAILTVVMMLLSEQSMIFVREMGRVFEHRLDDEARRELGIAHLYDNDKPNDWYFLAWRAMHRIIDLWDAWPAPRRLLTRDERSSLDALRDKNIERRAHERSMTFTNTLLEATAQNLPRAVRRQRLALSVDQTVLRAPSQKNRWPRENGVEQPMFIAGTDKEQPKYAMELEADLYPIDKGEKERVFSKHTKENGKASVKQARSRWLLAYTANLIIDVNEDPTGDPTEAPQLIRGASLTTPNKGIGFHTVELVKNIQERGYDIARLSSDLGYSAGLTMEDFHRPMRELGVGLVFDYNRANQTGVRGQVGGAKLVEGGQFCPGTPKRLLDATVRRNNKEIDNVEWSQQIDERDAYRLHKKEGPDANGNVKMRCPALGPSATVECPLRKLDKRASPDKERPQVLRANVPKQTDKVCCQTSITVRPEDGEKMNQMLPYGSKEWSKTYRRDRNSIESFNAFIKTGPERIADSSARRLRGLAAQQFLLAMLTTAANIRKIVTFLAAKHRAPKDRDRRVAKGLTPVPAQRTRRRDAEGMSNYRADYVRPELSPFPTSGPAVDPPPRT